MSFGGGQDSTTNPNNAGSESSSVSGGSSTNSSSSFRDPASVWGGQSPFLQGLYGMGANMFGAPSGPATGRGDASQYSNPANYGGQGFTPNASGGLVGQSMDQAQGLYDKAIGGFDQLMNPGVNPQLDAYAGEVQRNFDRNIMPGIQSSAAGFGQLGGSRQGVAEGIAAGDANQQMTDMASNLYNADMNRMTQAMTMAPQLGAFGQGIPWYGVNQYAGILGDPTVLQGAAGSEAEGSSSSFGASEGSSFDIGGGTDNQGYDFTFGFPTGEK